MPRGIYEQGMGVGTSMGALESSKARKRRDRKRRTRQEDRWIKRQPRDEGATQKGSDLLDKLWGSGS